MTPKMRRCHAALLILILGCLFPASARAEDYHSLLNVTSGVRDYAYQTVRPLLGSAPQPDNLDVLKKIAAIIADPRTGVSVNRIPPNRFMIYDLLEKTGFGFLAAWSLSPEQREVIGSWRARFMKANPADVFFAPSADDIIQTKAAFGCSHYARAFMAVVKALKLVTNEQNLRYAVSTTAEDYNLALESNDYERTLNGHQFVLVKIDNNWTAINTSKAECVELPKTFSPYFIGPANNVAVKFPAYPEVVFLLRKIGRDHDDDCHDNSWKNLMNIYRSGDAMHSDFRWKRYEPAAAP